MTTGLFQKSRRDWQGPALEGENFKTLEELGDALVRIDPTVTFKEVRSRWEQVKARVTKSDLEARGVIR